MKVDGIVGDTPDASLLMDDGGGVCGSSSTWTSLLSWFLKKRGSVVPRFSSMMWARRTARGRRDLGGDGSRRSSSWIKMRRDDWKEKTSIEN